MFTPRFITSRSSSYQSRDDDGPMWILFDYFTHDWLLLMSVRSSSMCGEWWWGEKVERECRQKYDWRERCGRTIASIGFTKIDMCDVAVTSSTIIIGFVPFTDFFRSVSDWLTDCCNCATGAADASVSVRRLMMRISDRSACGVFFTHSLSRRRRLIHQNLARPFVSLVDHLWIDTTRLLHRNGTALCRCLEKRNRKRWPRTRPVLTMTRNYVLSDMIRGETINQQIDDWQQSML